ncbi:MAG: nucleotidyl transferase AbiEii/AbiGii toxin family protein [Verrucomicrobia bacterium]|nr:nucleotidyl transferase AbiEii/AbiGii toxin family protein [Verrucomicrobiota bacterium]MCH8512819.1 nucleotidyl transferase AbiEii/AbiGii toxin family protein [Kiritimatiellia bacterium]
MTAEEKLLFEIINRLHDRFGKHAILRGGMVLRILGCERYTNDVDYVFVPYASKKDIVEDVLAALRTLSGVTLDHSMNSKCLRIKVFQAKTAVQVEIKTAMDESVIVLSTKYLAEQMGLPPRLLPVVDLSLALADKLAAWNERRLPRDLYDVFFFLRMGIRPDPARLEKRLLKPQYSKLVKDNDRFHGAVLEAFYSFLREKIMRLDEDDFLQSLADILPSDELPGLLLRLRAEVAKL